MILTISDLRWMDEQRRSAMQLRPLGDTPAAPRPCEAGVPLGQPAEADPGAAAGGLSRPA